MASNLMSPSMTQADTPKDGDTDIRTSDPQDCDSNQILSSSEEVPNNALAGVTNIAPVRILSHKELQDQIFVLRDELASAKLEITCLSSKLDIQIDRNKLLRQENSNLSIALDEANLASQKAEMVQLQEKIKVLEQQNAKLADGVVRASNYLKGLNPPEFHFKSISLGKKEPWLLSYDPGNQQESSSLSFDFGSDRFPRSSFGEVTPLEKRMSLLSEGYSTATPNDHTAIDSSNAGNEFHRGTKRKTPPTSATEDTQRTGAAPPVVLCGGGASPFYIGTRSRPYLVRPLPINDDPSKKAKKETAEGAEEGT
ncbi:MAG: hypothetical protein Q9170_003552 [Blastenia crenularia]